eukprot:scaffold840_cov265-Pinguiococcus_pyrenoidosus.AAC.4
MRDQRSEIRDQRLEIRDEKQESRRIEQPCRHSNVPVRGSSAILARQSVHPVRTAWYRLGNVDVRKRRAGRVHTTEPAQPSSPSAIRRMVTDAPQLSRLVMKSPRSMRSTLN